MHTLNRVLLLCTYAAITLSLACGGGGGGGGNQDPQEASQLSLTATPNTIQGTLASNESGVGIATVTLSVANWQSQTNLYFNAYDTTGAIQDLTFTQAASTVTAAISCAPWWLGEGTSTDSLVFAVSTDAEGKNQITGSPISIPISIAVTGPTISSISPNIVESGCPSFTLAVNGTGLSVPGMVVRWDGTDLPTTYISPTTLTATVPAVGCTASAGMISVLDTSNGTASNYFYLEIKLPGANPPTISPTSAVAGGPGFTLTYIDQGTTPYMLDGLCWNGQRLACKQIGPDALTAEIPASAIATAGTAIINTLCETTDYPGAGIEFPIQAAGTVSTSGAIAVPANMPSLPRNLALSVGLHKHWDRMISRD
jgi:hypothetical protein